MKNGKGPTPPPNDSEREPSPRKLSRHPEYERTLDEIFETFSQARSVMAGLEDFVRSRPEMGMAVEGLSEEFASWISKPVQGRRVRVVYQYDEDSVTLLDAWTIRDTDAFGRPR